MSAGTYGAGLELVYNIGPANGLLGEAVAQIVAGLVVAPHEPGSPADG